KRMTSSNEHQQLWQRLNDGLSNVKKFQNLSVSGCSDHEIEMFEQRVHVKLPDDIKQFLRVHNGREKISFGLPYRLATTDLLPLEEWKPYEKQEWVDMFFKCLNEECCDAQLLKEDAEQHLKLYRRNGKSVKETKFLSLPCEILVIGNGMDDYCEEILLGLKTGQLYLAVQNIPEWSKIGTFKDWIETGLNAIEERMDDIKESHDEN
ncbi:unnamed protein product, partial [Didymodactylos carnosus]